MYSLLILAFFFLSPFSAHVYLHDKQNFTLTTLEDPHPSKFLKYSASDYQNLRITFDYTSSL